MQEIQEFVSGKHDISKLFGILTTVKSSNKSHPAEFKVLKRYTADLPDVHRLVSLDLKTAWILLGLFYFIIFPKYNNFPTTCICQFVCIPFIHDTQYNVIVISKVDSSWM
jgi:hypothetical protein